MAEIVMKDADPRTYLMEVMERAYEIAQHKDEAVLKLTEVELDYIIHHLN